MTNARTSVKWQGYRPTYYALTQSLINRSEDDKCDPTGQGRIHAVCLS